MCLSLNFLKLFILVGFSFLNPWVTTFHNIWKIFGYYFFKGCFPPPFPLPLSPLFFQDSSFTCVALGPVLPTCLTFILCL